MIDAIYQTVQSLLNKEQLGYLKPLRFNLYARLAQRKIYNDYFIDLKSQVRKQNWMLDGKNFADLPKHTRQLIEHFSDETEIAGALIPMKFLLPDELEFVEDIFYNINKSTSTKTSEELEENNVRIEVVPYSEFLDLPRNRYVPPTNKNPYGSKVGKYIKVAPKTIETIKIHFLRKPLDPKWTFNDESGVAFFDGTADDYQDFDLPETSYDALIHHIHENASTELKNELGVQVANQNQSQDFQENNRQ